MLRIMLQPRIFNMHMYVYVHWVQQIICNTLSRRVSLFISKHTYIHIYKCYRKAQALVETYFLLFKYRLETKFKWLLSKPFQFNLDLKWCCRTLADSTIVRQFDLNSGQRLIAPLSLCVVEQVCLHLSIYKHYTAFNSFKAEESVSTQKIYHTRNSLWILTC